jgi:hypothetical protein
MTAFWDIFLFILIEVDRRFRGGYCLRHGDHGETSVHFNQTTWCDIREVCHHTQCYDSLKSQKGSN